MKPKTLYLALCLAGVLLPYWQFLPWALQQGLNLPLFARELFANRRTKPGGPALSAHNIPRGGVPKRGALFKINSGTFLLPDIVLA